MFLCTSIDHLEYCKVILKEKKKTEPDHIVYIVDVLSRGSKPKQYEKGYHFDLVTGCYGKVCNNKKTVD